MPVEFDPDWEYWEPNPEIAYAMSVPLSNRDLISEFYADVRRDGFTCGMRFGRGDPNYCRTYLGRDRTRIRERTRIADRYCSKCRVSFSPRNRKQVYCSKKCFLACAGAPRELLDVICEVCKKEFRPTKTGRRFCSQVCFGNGCKDLHANRKNKPINQIDQQEFSRMFLSGIPIKEMEKTFNVTRSTIKNWRKQIKLTARKVGCPGKVSFDNIDQELFSKMYLEGASLKSMMETFNTTKCNIQRWRTRLKLPPRPSGNSKKS